MWTWVCSGVLRDLSLTFIVCGLWRERLSIVDNEMVKAVFQTVVVTSKVSKGLS